jgi:hypothetical protein
VVKREQLEAGGEIHHQTELESNVLIARYDELKTETGKTRPRKLKAKPKTQLRPPPKRPSGHRAITRPEPKRLPAPRQTKTKKSGFNQLKPHKRLPAPRLNRGEPPPGPAP